MTTVAYCSYFFFFLMDDEVDEVEHGGEQWEEYGQRGGVGGACV